MISKDELLKFVSSRSWYQTIRFEDDVVAHGPAWCGDPAWDHIKQFLPESLDGMRILDLGCNAGIFCVRACEMGAKEVVGIDYTGWRPNWDFEEQQVFVKSYFEQKHERELPIKFISGKMSEVLSTQDIGHFDYVLGIASLYYSFNNKLLVQSIYDTCDNAILRLRDENRIKAFTTLFEQVGYKRVKEWQEKWWEILGRPNVDDFWLFLYEKEKL